ncbi:hypothetical protein D3C85_293120 [compost metagenome]
MNKQQAIRQIQLLHKDLDKVQKRMNKIAKALGIEENSLINQAILEVECLLEIIANMEVKGGCVQD